MRSLVPATPVPALVIPSPSIPSPCAPMHHARPRCARVVLSFLSHLVHPSLPCSCLCLFILIVSCSCSRSFPPSFLPRSHLVWTPFTRLVCSLACALFWSWPVLTHLPALGYPGPGPDSCTLVRICPFLLALVTVP